MEVQVQCHFFTLKIHLTYTFFQFNKHFLLEKIQADTGGVSDEPIALLSEGMQEEHQPSRVKGGHER